MATNATTVPVPGTTAEKEDATDFIGSLATATAPLLILFGELATKQFLSLSMGWADDVLLAIGPIGIMTIVVSAIRIKGFRQLKALIGRARESPADAEQEFLSSTSDQVCELWSGHEVVRLKDTIEGEAIENLVTTFIANTDLSSDIDSEPDPEQDNQVAKTRVPSIMNASEAYDEEIIVPVGLPWWVDTKDQKYPKESPPNITLNSPGSFISWWEMITWILVSILIQSFAFVFPAVATYHYKWQRKGQDVASFAYPLFASGLLLTTVGILLCGRTIEDATWERIYSPVIGDRNGRTALKGFQRHMHQMRRPKRAVGVDNIVQMQLGCTVGTQKFPPCAILIHGTRAALRVSVMAHDAEHDEELEDLITKKKTALEKLVSWLTRFRASAASLIAVTGFVLQVVGLAVLHWSATVTVLGTSFSMACIRAWVRRGLAKDLIWARIPDEHELAWAILRIVRGDWFERAQATRSPDNKLSQEPDCRWGPLVGLIEDFGTPSFDLRESSQPPVSINDLVLREGWTIEMRVLLGDIQKDTYDFPHVNGQLLELYFTKPDKFEQRPEILAGHDAIKAMPAFDRGAKRELAKMLANAMSGIVGVLQEAPFSREIFKSWTSTNWHIDIQGEHAPGNPFIIRLEPMPEILPDLNLLASVISLHTYTIYCRSASIQSMLKSREVGSCLEPFSLRRLRMTHCHSVRILSSSDWCSLDEMRNWTRNSTLKALDASPPERRFDWRRPRHMVADLPYWQLPLIAFGIYNSSSFTWQAKPPGQDPLRGRMEGFTPRSVQELKGLHNIVSFAAHDDIAHECTLELINLFLLTICQHCPSFASKDEARQTLDWLADELVVAGLCSSTNQALIYIVPAFARFGLLPGQKTTARTMTPHPSGSSASVQVSSTPDHVH